MAHVFCSRLRRVLRHRPRDRRRTRGQTGGQGSVPVRGHGRAFRVPAAGRAVSADRPAGTRSAASSVRRLQHRLRPVHHARPADRPGRQRQRANVRGQVSDRRLPRAGGGRHRAIQAPGPGQGEYVPKTRGVAVPGRESQSAKYSSALSPLNTVYTTGGCKLIKIFLGTLLPAHFNCTVLWVASTPPPLICITGNHYNNNTFNKQ